MHRPAPHRSPVARLVLRAAAVLVLVVAGPPTPVRAAIVPSDSPNRLDQPMADVALLDRDGPDDAPRLLVVDEFEPEPGVRRLSILRRDSAWGVASELTVDVGASGLTPWLIGLGADRFVLLGVSEGSDDTVVIGLRTDAGPGGNELAETGRTQLTTPITDAGAADVDGDGTPELVLAVARTIRDGGTCQGSLVWVVDASSLATRAVHSVPGRRLAAGVIGRWDDVPGDDLLAYAYDNCPAGPDTPSEASLIALRLSDGGSIMDRPDLAPISSSPLPPVRLDLDLDGTGTHEAVAMIGDGLAVLDPAADWSATIFGSVEAFPVLASDRPEPGGQAVRVAWIQLADGPETALVRRGPGGVVEVDDPGLFVDSGLDASRRQPGFREALAAGRHQTPAPGWMGATTDEGCLDLLLPGAMLACGEPAMRAGAAWHGTRPLAVVLDGPDRRLLVAAGMSLDTEMPFVRTPSPWASGPAGWWRHGPSGPFALAELSAGDATYYREFPVPRSSVEGTTAPDATTAIPGFTGVRLFVRAAAISPDTPDPRAVGIEGFVEGKPGGADIGILRIPVPPGVEAGRDGGFARISLGDLTLAGGSRADRWSVAVIPINDWGEMGSVARGVVIRDAIGPSLVIEPPFTTAIWPFPASIPGAAEPRSTVVVAGVGPMELDRRGQFTIQTRLAPWPQTLVVTATDASGNVTRREVSVIGGVDYRRFPWAPIVAAALLIAVMASGLVGNRWRRAGGGHLATTGRPAYAVDDGPVAEMEDLPPGAGLR